MKSMCDSKLGCRLCEGDNDQKAVKISLLQTIPVSREVQKHRSTLPRNRMMCFNVCPILLEIRDIQNSKLVHKALPSLSRDLVRKTLVKSLKL